MSVSGHLLATTRGLSSGLVSAELIHSASHEPQRNTLLHHVKASDWSVSATKRLCDIVVALTVLFLFAVPMLFIAACVRLTSSGPAIFVQKRVGRNGKLFSIYKFRSMYCALGKTAGLGLTGATDSRITPVGRVLRKSKLDELPQFYNILRGDMSLVGPRPKLPQYAAIVNMPYRPGITGAATIAFRREEDILCRVHPSQIDHFYNRAIKPLKARVDTRYMSRATFWSDTQLMFATARACVRPAKIPSVFRAKSPLAAGFLWEQSAGKVSDESFGTAN